MKLDLYINEANDYARDIGAPVLHPHVAIIHYDEAGEIRHSLNRIDCYGIFLQREFPENLTYGIGTYHEGDGSLMAYSPGQIGGKRDDGTRRQYHGWVLLFDAAFIHGTEIERRLSDYYATGRQRTDGLPSVKYCASELCLSPSYFGDIVRSALGESPKDYIRDFIVMRAKSLIVGGTSMSQTSEQLGFEYLQHFTRMFKQQTGKTPSEYLAEHRKK